MCLASYGKPFIILALYVCVRVILYGKPFIIRALYVCVCMILCGKPFIIRALDVCVSMILYGKPFIIRAHKLQQRYILLCTLYLHTCQVRVTADDSGLRCCTRVTYFERLLECWLEWCERCEHIQIYLFKLRLILHFKTAKCRQYIVKPSLFLFTKVQSCHEMNGKAGDWFLSQTVIANCWRNVLHYD